MQNSACYHLCSLLWQHGICTAIGRTTDEATGNERASSDRVNLPKVASICTYLGMKSAGKSLAAWPTSDTNVATVQGEQTWHMSSHYCYLALA